jgi:hypothetical protein
MEAGAVFLKKKLKKFFWQRSYHEGGRPQRAPQVHVRRDHLHLGPQQQALGHELPGE